MSIVKTCEICIKPYIVIYKSLRNYCKPCNEKEISRSSQNISKFFKKKYN